MVSVEEYIVPYLENMPITSTQDSGIDEDELSMPLQRLFIERPEEESSDQNQEDIEQEISELLEKYLSDFYLTQDYFLLKNFRKNKEGWVSLKFISTYKKMRKYSKNTRALCAAVSRSPLLELNSDHTKMRRLKPLPDYLKDFIPTRTVLLANLPAHLQTMSAISLYVSRFGTASSVCVVSPGKSFPSLINSTVRNLPHLRTTYNAVVELEDFVAAKNLVLHATRLMDGPEFAIEIVKPWNKNSSSRFSSRKTSQAPSPAKMTKTSSNRKISAPAMMCTTWTCSKQIPRKFSDSGYPKSSPYTCETSQCQNWRQDFQHKSIV